MAEKDVSEKHLEDFPDVFPDLMNVLLFHGEQIVQPDALMPLTTRSMYKADDRLHEMERDVQKEWRQQNYPGVILRIEEMVGAVESEEQS